VPEVNPLAAPAGVLGALQQVPLLLQRIESIAVATRALPEMRDAIQRVERDTSALPELRKDMAKVAAATDVLPTMLEHMAAIESAMPVLVEVQQHLAVLPEATEALGTGLGSLAALLDRLLASLEQLDANVHGLHSSLQPLGRIAERLPGSRR